MIKCVEPVLQANYLTERFAIHLTRLRDSSDTLSRGV